MAAVARMIRLALQGPASHRTGRVQIGTDAWGLVTWHKRADGHVQSTTANGEQVTLATAGGKGAASGSARGGGIYSVRLDGRGDDGACGAGVTDEELGVAGAVKVLDLFSGIDGFPDGCRNFHGGDLIRPPPSSPSASFSPRRRRVRSRSDWEVMAPWSDWIRGLPHRA